ncbi:serine/threonine protein kinase [Persicimonas caeni]|uniref:Serine/threonine protein kinase n=1 Tax=Persicimonas caeni TaxID=2292766 RepID=A0A4Y6PX79_PERCE|nr:serine/threonine-protein kinase [Persicimonas caeni]QDG52830.1 serine/threonine protein kinase [Persicimonas caeni]QED34052.1 serine/threonine protein kinase [Persicimonas caeni]
MNAPTKADKIEVDKTKADRLAEFTKVWETIGLQDQTIDVKLTHTMRPKTKLMEADARRSLPRLPRLVGPRAGAEAPEAMPELDFKHTIGEGGMGLVSLANQVPMGRDVAVKGLRDEARSQEMRMALLREGWTTGLLEHPNIIPVYTLGRDADDEPLIVMKRIEGVSWSELLRDPSKAPRDFDSDDPLDWHIDILAQVCNAVHYAHSKGIIHRDLKPENVMIGEFGEVYVLDWGIAVRLDEDPRGRLPSVAEVTSPAGTPAYMAPEMVTGDGRQLSKRTDVYLLGAILHEILTGHPPHRGDTLQAMLFEAFCSQPHDYDVSVPQPLVDICHRAMAADPAERFESAEAFRHALVDFTRHREALALADEAAQRLAILRDMLSEDARGDSADAAQVPGEAQIYKLFGECRFGFEQALRVERDNPAAKHGLQAVLETMAERELSRGAYQAASLLIADFPEPRPDFDRRLEALGEELENREQEFEHLQKIKREVDPEVGRTSRSVFAAVLGVVFCGLGVLIDTSWRFWDMPITHELLVAHGVFLVVMLVVALRFGRRWLFQNSANRRMMLGLLMMLIGSACYRTIIWIADLPLMPAIAGEVMYYGMGAAILGFAQDRRIAWSGLPYFPAGFLGALFPNYVMLIFAVTNLVALWVLAWALWPRRC